ncbi:TetR/AcrR family transcriptional regulator C-terminal domain-containing protein [Streptomyces sp. NRRL F-4489]|uniref:TetR/AcrR family transcriptional regulator C-terminal domain-containing protein n=1 Tax=Streptomyces sp. NRRL F-4489 TaxID=1609095 RepID=UPI00099EEE0E|nr:TetR/AcrR family transcriptional regulator C-terminal domain-containing protein [Streptomyces sp. NRRL F-4489]
MTTADGAMGSDMPGKAELLGLMLDSVAALPVDGLPEPGPETGWRPALEAVAHASWRLHLEHPWLLQVDQGRPLLGPNALDCWSTGNPPSRKPC